MQFFVIIVNKIFNNHIFTLQIANPQHINYPYAVMYFFPLMLARKGN